MNWHVEFTQSSRKAFLKLDKPIQQRIRQALNLLAAEMTEHQRPVRSDVAKMRGRVGEFRLKIPQWRVLFRFEQDHLIVLVVEVGHRSDIY